MNALDCIRILVVLMPTVGMILWVVFPRTGRKPVHEDPDNHPRP